MKTVKEWNKNSGDKHGKQTHLDNKLDFSYAKQHIFKTTHYSVWKVFM